MHKNFSQKSTESFAAARLLMDNHHHSSSINRSYYSFFQFLMFVLYTKLKIDPKEFDSQLKQTNSGSHTWASKLISFELAKRNQQDYKWFQRTLPELKDKRVRADYFEDVQSSSDSINSNQMAESLINMLNKNFK